jgi:hypothetical protein
MMPLSPQRETAKQAELPVWPLGANACSQEADYESDDSRDQAYPVEQDAIKATKNCCELLEDPPKGG